MEDLGISMFWVIGELGLDDTYVSDAGFVPIRSLPPSAAAGMN